MMKVRVSERQTFKRCRKQWDYSSPNRQNLTPVRGPIALQFGTMYHSTHELWMEDEAADPVQLFKHVAWKQLEKIKSNYRAAVGAEISDDELGDFYDHVELGMDMFESYKQKWGSPIPEGYELVSPEQTVQIQVEGMGVTLQGTFDAILKDTMTDRHFILERKTYSQRPRLDVLESNDQFLAYLWMLQQLDIGPVGGIFYDGAWKRKLEGKRTLDDLFFRRLLTRPQYELDMFGSYLERELDDIISDPNIYLNRRWEGCHDCQFEKLCLAESKGEDADYIRKQLFMENPEPEEE